MLGKKHGHGGRGGGWGGAVYDGYDGWRVRIEALTLHRNVSDTVNFGPLSTRDLDFQTEFGFRAALEYRLRKNHSIEVVYFGTQNWSDSARATDTANGLNVAFIGTPHDAFTGASVVHVAYSSELHNLELNYWLPVFAFKRLRGSLVFGGRYMSVPENFRLISRDTANNASGQYDVETCNDLFGGQTGFYLAHPVLRYLTARWEARAGVYGNHNEQDTRIRASNPTFVFNESQDDVDFAFIGSAGIVLNYHIDCNITAYLGYEFMWVNGLALATENFNNVFPTGATRVARLENDGSVLYQGFSLGCEFMW